jgi:hypothetical protein
LSGDSGLSIAACRKAGDRPNSRVVTQALNRLIAAGEVKRRGAGKTLHYWDASQPDAGIDTEWKRVAAEIARARQEATTKSNRECWERKRRASGKVPLDVYRAQLRAQSEARKDRLRLEAEQRAKDREAKRAQKLSMAEIAKAAAKVRQLDAQATPQTRHRPMITLKRGDHMLTNACAAKIKGDGTRGPAPKEAPAPTIVWPEHVLVQVAARAPGRYDVLEVPGVFSSAGVGHYVAAPVSCAARAYA